MRINEIESDEQEIADMLLRKVARTLRSDTHIFPSWFRLFDEKYTGYIIKWPAAGNIINTNPNLGPLTAVSDISMNISGYTMDYMFASDYMSLDLDTASIDRSRRSEYFPYISIFLSKVISKSDPAFYNVKPEDFDVRSISSFGSHQHVLIRSDAMKKITDPIIRQHGYLIKHMINGKKFKEFANLIKKANQ